MPKLRLTDFAMGQTCMFMRWSLHRRHVLVRYRTDGAAATAPVSSVSAGLAHVDGLTFTQLACPSSVLDAEPLQSLTRLAATNQPCQVLEAISKTALVLRDAAIAGSRGTSSPHSAGIGMQALFQNGYDTLVALLQALPQCSSAYGPAAVIPETCVKLFHVHNLLLQAAYASQQDFDAWTELMQAGVELYLRKAPRHIVTFNTAQLDAILDAVAHQDLWRLQRLLWQRLLSHVSSWDSMQDFCSVVQECELAAQAATTAAAAAAAAAAAVTGVLPSRGGGSSNTCLPGSMSLIPSQPDLPASWSDSATLVEALHASGDALSLPWLPGSLEDSSDMPTSANPSISSSLQTMPSMPSLRSSEPHLTEVTGPHDYVDARTADSLYDKQTELAEYGSLMSECIRVALEGASERGLAAAVQPHAAAVQLLEIVSAYDARQRCPGALTALRYAFIPTSDWLSRVAVAGVQAGEQLSAAQVVKLLQDLNGLAPTPSEGHSTSNRWLNATGQAALERAVVHYTSIHAWSPQQAVSVIKALTGKCRAAPGDQLCGLIECLLLVCDEARQDVGLLCAVLQEAVELVSSTSWREDHQQDYSFPSAIPHLTTAHHSLVNVALNRASYLVESTAPSTDSGVASTSALRVPSGSGRMATTGPPYMWRSREFLFERYPKMLQAARCFGYPLQAFRLEEYADELYKHLATSPGHELVAVGPEGLALVLQAVASSPCCRDPQWAAAFERACLTLVSVQFSVGYTHPKRWLGLLEATVDALPFPMPALAAGVKALLVRLCDTRRHAKYFWNLLPVVGKLERRAAAAAASARGHHFYSGSHHSCYYASSSSQQGAAPVWTPVAITAGGSALKVASPSKPNGKARSGRVRRASSSGRSIATTSAPSSGKSKGISNGSAVLSSSLRPVMPLPDISKYHVSEEEYSRWCEDLGRCLALSMASLSDQDRVAQLSVLGINTAGP